MLMKKTNLLFALGLGSLAISLILNQYFPKNMVVLFFIGVFAGLSIVFNIVFLVKKGREIRARNLRDKQMAR